MLILAIDPGARETGIAVVEFGGRAGGRGKLITSATVRSTADTGVYLPVPDEYTDELRRALIVAVDVGIDVAVVEDTKPPNWHMERAAYSPAALIATSQIAGWCLGFLAAAPMGHQPPLRVPPHGNGAGVLGNYPSELVSATERRDPTWRVRAGGAKAQLRHERSAYDVARVGYRMYTSTRPAPLR